MSEARRYRLIETLGKGAFGTVYRAEIIGPGGFAKQVALKVLNRDDRMPEEMALRLRDEARILGLIRHRAVVGVDNLADFGDAWGVVMEYVAGVDLAIAAHHARIPARVALEIIEEIASALHAAWALPSDVTGKPLRLVHRDIKLSNIRLTAQGEVKVLDFGVARADFQQREAATRSLLFGSMRYMAPERLDGVDGHETDLYALGVVLAELLAGDSFDSPPTNPKRNRAWLDGVLSDVRRSVSLGQSPEDAPDHEPLIQLIGEMIAFEPGERPSGREVERRARTLKGCFPGPHLREWAEVEVPRLAEHVPPRELTEGAPAILVEKSGSVALHNELASTQEFATEVVRSAAVAHEPASAASSRPQLAYLVAGVLLLVGILAGGAWLVLRPTDEVPELVSPIEPVLPVQAASAADEEQAGMVAPADPDVSDTPEPTSPPPPTASAPVPEPPPVAAPMPEPEPVRPEPTPAAPPSTGTVVVTGDARSVWLDGPEGSFPAGAVPPGSYTIKAWFDNPDPATAGSVAVSADEQVTVHCVAAMLQCRRR